ncbi:MAG: ribonuclease III [Candidatus Eremiobacteraeota bacterium]|nr:ribonuclease III [Candidatus Eremiobacteraeota bacterium]
MAGEGHRRRLRAMLRRTGLGKLASASIERAFVHDSAVLHERSVDPNASNERLEFLGDAVLSLATARWLYIRYPQDREGELTRRRAALVNDQALALTAKRLEFPDLMILSPGESAAGGAERASILAGAFEAFLGAVYLGGGIDVAAAFVEREHLARIEHAEMASADPKTALQEFTQARLGTVPAYAEASSGPAHRRVFTSIVRVGGAVVGEGIGPSKKAAQRAAAENALNVLVQGETALEPE